MQSETCERLATQCARRLARAKDPKVRERIERERHDWLELAENHDRVASLIEELRGHGRSEVGQA